MASNETATIIKLIKKMEKEYERMKKQAFDANVISAQEAAINEKKELLKQLNKQEDAKKGDFDKDMFLKFSVVNENTLEKTERQSKVAFVKNNRPINNKKVDGFITLIADGKYEKAFPIIAISAADAIANGYEVRDVKGMEIEGDQAVDYLVILDGQHRMLAFLMCNMIEERTVPNTYIKKVTDIGKYLVDINDVGTSWNQQDRFAVAALTSNNELAQEIADRISEGYSPTTASLIYTGKKISSAQVKKLLRGENLTLPEGSNLDIPRGNKFIQLCKEAHIDKKFIKKRYFINGFNAHAISVGEEAAFESLKNLKGRNITEEKLKRIKDDQGFIRMLTTEK